MTKTNKNKKKPSKEETLVDPSSISEAKDSHKTASSQMDMNPQPQLLQDEPKNRFHLKGEGEPLRGEDTLDSSTDASSINMSTGPEQPSQPSRVEESGKTGAINSSPFWARIPFGDVKNIQLWKVPIVTIRLDVGSDLHVTVIFTSVGLPEKDALDLVYRKLVKELPSPVTISRTDQLAPFRDTMHPENTIYLVKINGMTDELKGMCSRLNRYDLIPHISFPPETKVVDEYKGEWKVELLYPHKQIMKPSAYVTAYVSSDSAKDVAERPSTPKEGV